MSEAPQRRRISMTKEDFATLFQSAKEFPQLPADPNSENSTVYPRQDLLDVLRELRMVRRQLSGRRQLSSVEVELTTHQWEKLVSGIELTTGHGPDTQSTRLRMLLPKCGGCWE
ncbi:hypothetical protein IHE55_17500 [Streptomyces pactum]|uniref:Uncharacterized protein n=1 Tax=Streptomyces pactum TaxID=68249 RepID=A0ABS0NMQ9_9ACTN|nr:hypothetical protein [Streptomyces pactum]MBH5336473.1 hypothetical protein [Streptomyces pactum]